MKGTRNESAESEGTLLGGGAAASTKLIAAGCAAGITQAMRWHPGDEDVATTSACAALSLASGDGRNANEVAAAGAAAEAAAARALGLNVGRDLVSTPFNRFKKSFALARLDSTRLDSRGGG